MAGEFAPFEIEAGDVTMFAATEVVYLQVTRGAEELRKSTPCLCARAAGFWGAVPTHPHITLGQELGPGGAEAAFEVAVRRWREYQGPRSFRAEKAVFVQNTAAGRWIDLASSLWGRCRSDKQQPASARGQATEDQDRFARYIGRHLFRGCNRSSDIPRRIEDPGHTAIVVLGPHIFPA